MTRGYVLRPKEAGPPIRQLGLPGLLASIRMFGMFSRPIGGVFLKSATRTEEEPAAMEVGSARPCHRLGCAGASRHGSVLSNARPKRQSQRNLVIEWMSNKWIFALKRHYASGAPLTWQQEFVTAYATSHPWEDFAETFAHYLHIVDTLETARAFGLRTRPAVPDGDMLRAKIDFDPHRCREINQIIDVWLPLTLAMNCINRSMGQPDLYPFVLFRCSPI